MANFFSYRRNYIPLFLGLFLILNHSLLANKVDSLQLLIDQAESPVAKYELYKQVLAVEDITSFELLTNHKEQALKLCRGFDETLYRDTIYFTYTDRLIEVGKKEEAKSALLELLNIGSKEKNEILVASVRFKLGELALINGDFENGAEQLEMSKAVFGKYEAYKLQRLQADVQIATYHRDKGNFSEAEVIYKKILPDALQLNDQLLLLTLYNSYGRLFRKKASFDTARVYYEKALAIAKDIGQKKATSVALNNIGNMFHSNGNLEKALEYYIKSKDIKEELNYQRGISIGYHNIAAIRFSLGEFEKSIEDFEKSLALSEKIDFKKLIIHNYLKLGNAYRELGKYDQAIALQTKGIEMSEQMQFEQGIVEGNNYIGQTYLKQKNYGKAIEHLKYSYDLADKNNRKNYLSANLVYLAQCYMGIQAEESQDAPFSLERSLFGNQKEIEAMLLRGAKLAKEIESESNMNSSFEALALFYKKYGRHDKEAETLSLHMAYKDSLYHNSKATAIAELSTKYESSEKEKEILLLQKENEIQLVKGKASRARFIAGLVAVVFLAAGSIMFIYFQHQKKRTKQLEELRVKISADLHDDVGSILSGLAMQAELLQLTSPEVNQDKLGRMADMGRSAMSRMRDAVWAMDARNDKVENLVDRMKEFIGETLEAKDIDHNFELNNISLDKVIFPDVRQNVYLIFKEAVTNIVKHSNASIVKLSLENVGGQFKMTVKDNGNVAQKNYKTTGLGTRNMMMRAKKINGQLEFKREEGFGVYLSLPAIV